jgi:hypothetical protein
MLLSNNRRSNGLGNEHDLVGRFFMEHLHFWSGLLVIDGLHVFDRTSLYNEIHRVKGVPVIGKLALNEEVLRREQLLNRNIQLFPRLRPNPFK